MTRVKNDVYWIRKELLTKEQIKRTQSLWFYDELDEKYLKRNSKRNKNKEQRKDKKRIYE